MPSYVQAVHAVSRTDLVAVVPNGLARSLAEPMSLALFNPPIDPGEYDAYLFYPRHTKNDPASAWLRGITQEVRARLAA